MTFSFKTWMDENGASQEFGFDSADVVTFNSRVVELPTFDRRTDDELSAAAFGHQDACERERAMWELTYRHLPVSGDVLKGYFDAEPAPRVRSNLLWLARKAAPAESVGILRHALNDADRDVRDWARVHLAEITGEPLESEYSRGVYLRGTHFDQTVPLEIAGFAVVQIGDANFRVVLSPLWFARIQGRVMACTRDETFMTNLTIEKKYEGFHPDGTDHYEIYPFAGKSWASGEMETEHRYITNTVRPTYLSGRVEEDLENVRLAPMIAARGASIRARLLEVEERLTPAGPVVGVSQRRVVSYVKGQYFGWAFASLRHFMEHGDILPGTVQLVSPTEPEMLKLVNCYICGTFRGKLSDHNGDGLLDVNETLCHGAEDGNLDYLADGTFAPDPFGWVDSAGS